MKLIARTKKLAGIAAVGAALLLGMADTASAQGRRVGPGQGSWNNSRENDRMAGERARLEAERLRLEQERRRSQQMSDRYRVNRGGRWHNVNGRQADLLRQAVNHGYQQGFRAGQADRDRRGRGNWNNNGVYRSGTYGYQSHVDRGLYQHYFQLGFQRGYQDGYNSRLQYRYNSGGSVNILGAILNSLLNIQRY